MKELIIVISLLTAEEPRTCYCSSKDRQWTAYCIQQDWDCERCCEYTKPKDEDKPKENE
jgi:hypothetical protein|tara:strand:+ start:250 stop:426 length:177 start_codon:yes stop_codon:yes gene_type:complete